MYAFLFIIFGTKGITYSKGKGEFLCPQCGVLRDYNLKRVRRFFTLYFIPLVPLDMLGEYVECYGCDATWRPDVLTSGSEVAAGGADIEAEFRTTVRRVMVMMMLADGDIDPEEVEVIRGVFRDLSGREISAAEVQAEAAQVRTDDATIESYLASARVFLNNNGKEAVVKAAMMVAGADDRVDETERDLLDRIATALEITPAHFRGIAAEMASSPPGTGEG